LLTGLQFFLLVFLSCSIASFGLVPDSTAVIIGAMPIAPLISPILGLSLASVAGESNMFRRALVALIDEALLAMALLLLPTNFAATSFVGIVVFATLGLRLESEADRWHGLPRPMIT
jgi:Domain of unknown function (DUF389)